MNLKYNKTRFPEFEYGQLGKSCWTLFHVDPDGYKAQVGPWYATKLELLVDLPRYAKEFGIIEAQ